MALFKNCLLRGGTFYIAESMVPGRPTSLRVRPFPSSIVVSWTPPEEQHIMVRGYILGYGKGIADVYKQVLDAKQRYHTIKGLGMLIIPVIISNVRIQFNHLNVFKRTELSMECIHEKYIYSFTAPSSEYVITLRAFNTMGEGVPVYETTRTREEAGMWALRRLIFQQVKPSDPFYYSPVSSYSFKLKNRLHQ